MTASPPLGGPPCVFRRRRRERSLPPRICAWLTAGGPAPLRRAPQDVKGFPQHGEGRCRWRRLDVGGSLRDARARRAPAPALLRAAPSAASRLPVWQPPADVLETEREVLILVALPGVDPHAVEAAIEDGALARRRPARAAARAPRRRHPSDGAAAGPVRAPGAAAARAVQRRRPALLRRGLPAGQARKGRLRAGGRTMHEHRDSRPLRAPDLGPAPGGGGDAALPPMRWPSCRCARPCCSPARCCRCAVNRAVSIAAVQHAMRDGQQIGVLMQRDPAGGGARAGRPAPHRHGGQHPPHGHHAGRHAPARLPGRAALPGAGLGGASGPSSPPAPTASRSRTPARRRWRRGSST